MLGHRKGWKNRTGCREGKIQFLRNADGTTERYYTRGEMGAAPPGLANDEALSTPGVIAQATPAEESLGEPESPAQDVFGGAEDTEEIARQINAARQSFLAGEISPLESGLPEWQVEAGEAAPVSQDSLTIRLPVMARVMYDWAVGQGWKQGDGSLSAFIWDMLSHHWMDCMGMIVFVARREDIGVATGGGTKRG